MSERSYDPFAYENVHVDLPTLLGRPPTGADLRTTREKFLKGPIPLDWLMAAAHLPGPSTVRVALAIWYTAGLKNDKRFRLTTRTTLKFGVGKRGRASALKKLGRAKLIAIEKPAGKACTVTILI